MNIDFKALLAPGGLSSLINQTISDRKEEDRPRISSIILSAGYQDYVFNYGEPHPRLKMSWFIIGWYNKIFPEYLKLFNTDEKLKQKKEAEINKQINNTLFQNDCVILGFYLSKATF